METPSMVRWLQNMVSLNEELANKATDSRDERDFRNYASAYASALTHARKLEPAPVKAGDAAALRDMLVHVNKEFAVIARLADGTEAGERAYMGYCSTQALMLVTDAKAGDSQPAPACRSEGVNPMTLRTAIQTALGKRNWSQSDLANHLGVSRQYISRLLDEETTSPNFTIETLEKIASALDLVLTIFFAERSP